MQQRGFTVLELMVTVVVVGLLAAVAVPAFTAEAAKSKQSEAKLQLEKLAHNAVAYFAEHRKFPQGTAQVLPGEDGAACGESTKQFAVSTAWGADSVWSALDFSIEESSRFSYHFTATARKSARAWAVADISCSGNQVVYEVVLEGRETGRVAWVLIDPTASTTPDLPEAEADGEDFDSANAEPPPPPAELIETNADSGGSGGSGNSGGDGTGDGSGVSPTDPSSPTNGNDGSTGGSSSDGSSSGGSTSGGSTSGGSTSGGSSGGGSSAGGSSAGGSTAGGSSSGGSSAGGSTAGGSSAGGSTAGGGSSAGGCGGSAGSTTIVTCPTGYTLHTQTCTCKKSK
jgi:prepilin-type N-terminal cleavage/methylation domain-containing protein